jgi:hypothetical protein
VNGGDSPKIHIPVENEGPTPQTDLSKGAIPGPLQELFCKDPLQTPCQVECVCVCAGESVGRLCIVVSVYMSVHRVCMCQGVCVVCLCGEVSMFRVSIY